MQGCEDDSGVEAGMLSSRLAGWILFFAQGEGASTGLATAVRLGGRGPASAERRARLG